MFEDFPPFGKSKYRRILEEPNLQHADSWICAVFSLKDSGVVEVHRETVYSKSDVGRAVGACDDWIRQHP